MSRIRITIGRTFDEITADVLEAVRAHERGEPVDAVPILSFTSREHFMSLSVEDLAAHVTELLQDTELVDDEPLGR